MAIYRLHRKQWDRPYNTPSFRVKAQQTGNAAVTTGKRKLDSSHSDEDDDAASFKVVSIAKSGAVQRKGTSSGLTTVIKKSMESSASGGINARQPSSTRTKWWKNLGSDQELSKGSRGRVHVPTNQ